MLIRIEFEGILELEIVFLEKPNNRNPREDVRVREMGFGAIISQWFRGAGRRRAKEAVGVVNLQTVGEKGAMYVHYIDYRVEVRF